jgi:hypothetical protein
MSLEMEFMDAGSGFRGDNLNDRLDVLEQELDTEETAGAQQIHHDADDIVLGRVEGGRDVQR